jgi:hypothetical protein
VPRLRGDAAANRARSARKNADAARAWNSRDGGSWTSRQPTCARIGASSSRNVSMAAPALTSRSSCVMARGSFTEKRKPRGTLSAQRSKVERRCGR